MTATGQLGEQDRLGRMVMLVCLTTGFATLFDSAALVVATPVLASDLGADRQQLQWILAGYSLAFGLALIPAGRVGDAVGRPTILAVGLALFSSASTIAATASAPTTVVVARLAQGVGAGIANPQVIGLIQDHFRGSARARTLGWYQSMGAAGGLLAPIVGGAVMGLTSDGAGWRIVAVLNVPLAITAVLLAALVLRPKLPRAQARRRVDLDVVGLLMVTLVTLSLLLPFVAGTSNWLPWAAGAAGLLLGGAGLIMWERIYAARGRLPLITPELARAPGYAWGCLVATFTFGSALGFGAVLMLFLQQSMGMSPLSAGVVTIPSAIVSLVCTSVAWRLLRRFGRPGISVLLVAKTLIAIGAAVAVAYAPTAVVLPVLIIAQVLTGAVAGLSGSPNQALTLEGAPHDQHGVAAGVLQVSQRISATVSITALVGVFVALAGDRPSTIDAGRPGMVAVFAATAVLGLAATLCSWADSRGAGRADDVTRATVTEATATEPEPAQ